MARIKKKSDIETKKFNRIQDYLESVGKMEYGIVSKISRNLGITPNAVHQWLKNKQNPPIAQLLRLAAYLECKPEDLIVKDNPFAEN